MNNLLLILTSIFMGAIGQILLKFGANTIGDLKFNIEGFVSLITNYFVVGGLILFGTSFLLWIKVLTKNSLSYVYPMVSLSYIIIVLASRFLFNEPFTSNKIIGIIAIIVGVFLINK